MARRNDILERFGKKIRQLRLDRGLSQEAFAQECELDRTYIGGIERGERNVALLNIEKIATSLQVTLSDLMKGL